MVELGSIPRIAEACTGVLDGIGLRYAAKYLAVSSILGLYGCVLGFGGVYHAVLGPEILTTPFFAYRWQDKNAMASILGIPRRGGPFSCSSTLFTAD